MAGSKSAWGIELGAYALKAIRLERSGGEVRVADFAYIPHKKVLSTPDLDGEEMTRLAIGQFISQQRDMGQVPVVVSVPGNAAFARFAKLPPVEPKKVPAIVRFEAVQQIPFPIEEVEWDYQTFIAEGSPEVEVGIFAITQASVRARLGLYGELGLFPDGLTLSPVAVYNAIAHDRKLADSPTGLVILDIGTTSTDLIIAEEGRTWIRTFPIGGHSFTEALINAFKLTYSKAEKLKAEAQTSKYRRQILSAMRPVFGDLAQDVQRSIGYYQSMHRDADLSKLLGVGSTFRLPGLRKFLAQQLQMEVTRLDEFARLKSGGRQGGKFVDHSVNFATAYGLALQGVGMSTIEVNLVPVSVVRERMWGQKIKWFGAAAAVVVVGSLLSFARPIADGKYESQSHSFNHINRTIDDAKSLKREFDTITDETEIDARAWNIRSLLERRDIWAYIMADVSLVLASGDPQPELFAGDPEAFASIEPGDRRIMELVSFDYKFEPSSTFEAASEDADPDQESLPGLSLTMVIETPHDDAITFVSRTAVQWLRAQGGRTGVPYRIITNDVSRRPHLGDIRPFAMAPADDDESGSGRSGRAPVFRSGPITKGSRGRFAGSGELGMMGEGGREYGGVGEYDRGKARGGRSGSIGRGNLEAMAPLPERVEFLPPGTEFFHVTIQWQIQLLPPGATTAESSDAATFGVEG